MYGSVALDFDFRFGGIKRLVGQTKFEKLVRSHVCIVGIGGVGSWAAEALARSGVGKLTLVDYDDICESNVNRQIHSLDGVIGQQKIDVMKQRLNLISPELNVELLHERFDQDTCDHILGHSYSAVIDATDQLEQKCLLIATCKERRLPTVVAGGSAGKIDPTQISASDLAFSQGDRLLQKTRRKLRNDYGFSRDMKQEFGVRCVFSREESAFPLPNGEVTTQPDKRPSMPLDCNTGMGSISFLTGAFGFAAASESVKLITSL